MKTETECEACDGSGFAVNSIGYSCMVCEGTGEFIMIPYSELDIKAGDVLISKETHSCKVKFVEGADETGILLVDGIQDEFFEPEEFHLIKEKYKLLCKKEDRKDI